MSPLVRTRLERLGPGRSLPPGRFDPVVAFGRRAPVVVEIGCGHGDAALAYAAAFREHDLIAIDVYPPGVARLLAGADAVPVSNLRVEHGDAVVVLEERIGERMLDAVHLFFPDPWPKTRHAKRRFVSPANLDLLARVLRPDGHVLIATDQNFYVQHVLVQVAEHPRFVAHRAARPAWRPHRGFEVKGVAADRTITDLRLELVD